MAPELRLRADNKLRPCRSDACGGCNKRPPGTNKFAVCKGCGLRAYCSKECQVKDWQDHRAICKNTQRMYKFLSTPDESGRPPSACPERFSHLRKFWRIHKPIFEMVIIAMRRSGAICIDCDRDILVLHLDHRPDNNDNPALTFTLKGFDTCNSEELSSRMPEIRNAQQSGASLLEEEARHLQETLGQPVKHLTVCLVTNQDKYTLVALPIVDQAPPEIPVETQYERNLRDAWSRLLCYVVQLGVVLHPKDLTQKEWITGKMVRVGKEWQWRIHSSRERERLRLPSHLNIPDLSQASLPRLYVD